MSVPAIKTKQPEEVQTEFERLLAEEGYLAIPKVGDTITGKVLAIEKNRVYVDIEGYRPGIVRGPELIGMGYEINDLEPGTEVEATIIDLENESGQVELSFRHAGAVRAWETLRELMRVGTILPVKILDANKGGLTVRLHSLAGFMPVSQLAPEHYPRVSGGDKQKILEKLRSYIGTSMQVKVIDVSEPEEKLIVSEKTVWEDEQRGVLAAYDAGDEVEGAVTAIADFGVFVKFPPKGAKEGETMLEGLVHISEIAWQRIDHPKDILEVGDTVRAKIIGIEGSKIFLSMKSLIEDPWARVAKKYNVGDRVTGTILKENPFGFFVELDKEIHGLAHISELADRPVRDLHEIAKPGDTLEWRIVSIEPDQHRLGLSLKEESAESDETETIEKAEAKKEEAAESIEQKTEVEADTPVGDEKAEKKSEPEIAEPVKEGQPEADTPPEQKTAA
jgi:small subunit ribosomal protein S1